MEGSGNGVGFWGVPPCEPPGLITPTTLGLSAGRCNRGGVAVAVGGVRNPSPSVCGGIGALEPDRADRAESVNESAECARQPAAVALKTRSPSAQANAGPRLRGTSRRFADVGSPNCRRCPSLPPALDKCRRSGVASIPRPCLRCAPVPVPGVAPIDGRRPFRGATVDEAEARWGGTGNSNGGEMPDTSFCASVRTDEVRVLAALGGSTAGPASEVAGISCMGRSTLMRFPNILPFAWRFPFLSRIRAIKSAIDFLCRAFSSNRRILSWSGTPSPPSADGESASRRLAPGLRALP